MKRISQIIAHQLFLDKQKRIDELEIQREYCRHGLNHALDVARIIYILTLENHLLYKKDIIYATALLHDIGRCDQYENGIPHNEASVQIAEIILKDCGYEADEILLVTEAIRLHHDLSDGHNQSLSSLLYKADKLSRNCFACQAIDDCYWEEAQKNKEIFY